MRRVLQQSNKNSLDLLLDTMCNAFGGIILIAILIVLLSSDVVDSPVPEKNFPDKDSIERQIVAAEQSISEMKSQLDALEMDPLAAEEAKLREEIEAAKESLGNARQRAEELDSGGYVDYSAELAELRNKQRQAEAKLAQMQNEITALDTREGSLKRQIEAVTSVIKDMVAARTENMRLPKERETKLRGSSVIFLYNEIFWMHPGGRRNTESIIWNPLSGGDGVKLTPIRGKGWQFPQQKDRITKAISDVRGNAYIASYVFPDSVDAFRKFREEAANAGVDIGWSLETSVDELVFAAQGTSPAPQ
jgi:hypothetical protein